MLVLTRRKNEGVVIGDEVVVTVIEVRGDKVRLGVVPRKDMPVHRQEVYEALYGSWPRPPLKRPAEEAAFVQAILEEPDDEGLRLIFADWLQDRDDPYGEFIRTQCLLATLPPGDLRRDELEQRERALWQEHARTWRAYLPVVLRSTAFERGFVESACLTVPEFLHNAEAIFATAPLRRLHVRRDWAAPARDMAALASSLWLARLAGLDWSQQELGDGEAALLASPHAASLKSLVLRGNRIGDAGAAALAGSPFLANIENLNLTGNPIGQDGVKVLRDRFGERVRL